MTREDPALSNGKWIVALALVLAAGVGVMRTVTRADPPRTPPAAASNPPPTPVARPSARPARGWTRLPRPDASREGAAFVAAGARLLLWGGCDPLVHDYCRPTAAGVAFDSLEGRWEEMPLGPMPAAYVTSVWTGAEAVFLFERDESTAVEALAYDPAAGTWERVPSAPLTQVSTAVWTGSEVVAFEGGSPDDGRAGKAAAFDVATRRWRVIANPPVALNLEDALWTGHEVIVFGSLLDDRNRAASDVAEGAAYSPATDSWRRLPRSNLSPQATSAVWAGDEMVAWDYEASSQTYDPVANRWTKPAATPFEPSECYPSSEVVRERVFAFFCGDAGLFDTATEAWRPVRRGPLRATVERKGSYPRWSSASMASTGNEVYLLMTGLTFTKNDVPCDGCGRPPRSFWVFRPRVGAP